jgi:hypothetical protein
MRIGEDISICSGNSIFYTRLGNVYVGAFAPLMSAFTQSP